MDIHMTFAMAGARTRGHPSALRALTCMAVALRAVAASGKVGLTAAALSDPRTCSGKEEQYKQCARPACNMCVPRDCKFSLWTEWSKGSGCTGICTRQREIEATNNECGTPCGGPKVETKRCLSNECVKMPQDCLLLEWTDWGGCDGSYLNQMVRKRSIAVLPKNGGKECDGPIKETMPCGRTPVVHCALSEWGNWTACSASCGGGYHAQMRRVANKAALGGAPCEGSLRRTAPCNTMPCGETRNCNLGPWSDWSGCNLLSGIQKYREREVIQGAEHGGSPCDEPVKETVGCPALPDAAPEQCKVSSWSEWGACDKSCDGGQAFRKRRLLAGPKHGGGCGDASLFETTPCGTDPCTPPGLNDCKVSDWSSWSSCSAECGVGASLRERTILKPGKPGGLGCSASLKETTACHSSKAECGKSDCAWGDWEDWSACTCSCGGGTHRRNRVIKVAPRHGGKLCAPEDKSEVAPCNRQTCEVCIDGAWREWDGWSSCSASCGKGFRARRRDIERHPNLCGRPVTGLEDQYETCQADAPCVPSVDCALSDWGSWSACSARCFGVAERHRQIAHYASGDGRTCRREAMKQISQCNPGIGELRPKGCAEEPEPCTLAEWSEWEGCSATCGGGQKTRTRHILSPSRNDGKLCSDVLSQIEGCNTEPCSMEQCTDCVWGEWSDWGACSKCGDQRYRNRAIVATPNHCGKACDAGASKEVSSCQSDCAERRFCAWSEWSGYSPCSARCGPATRLRQRTLSMYSRPPLDYLFSGPESVTCGGTQLDVGACPYKSCRGAVEPVDCVFGEWGNWSAPACTQLCDRHRVIARTSKHHGKMCEGPLVETKRCARDCVHAEDCVLSDWHPWGPCAAHEAQKYRSRSVVQYASNGGRECSGNLEETESCSEPPPAPSACLFGMWSKWGECSASCGGGLQSRQRTIQSPAEFGGRTCRGSLGEMQKCNTSKCGGAPTPCQLGDWSKWSTCSHGATVRYHERKLLLEPANGGPSCDAFLKEVAPCFLAVDCAVSQWTAWDTCDKDCGGGQQSRHRMVTTSPRDGGRPCPTDLMETKGCHQAPCNRVDCAVSDWAEWSRCPASCGSGTQARGRRVTQLPQDGGEGCNLKLNETRDCRDGRGSLLPACPTVDCLWGLWSDWSSCSCSCDGGQRTRDRHIVQTPQVGGKPCDPQSKEEIVPCNTHKCRDERCIDGQWDQWTAWEPCSKSCDGGITWRMRKVLSEANECGTPATGLSREYSSCHASVPCEPDVDCAFTEWSKWSDCTKECDGIARRSRDIRHHARGRGVSCAGDLKQTAPCNPALGEKPPATCQTEFPSDCEFSEWGAWDSCSVSCGGGQQHRSRTVIAEAKDGGRCPRASLAETRACSSAPCSTESAPVDCEWMEWSEWSACDKCGGQKRRFRHVGVTARHGGRPCDAGASEEVTSCTRKCHERSFCAFGDWKDWGECSTSCGTGIQGRSRHLQLMTMPTQRFLEDNLGDAAELEDKFQQLHLETRDLEKRHLQATVVAFACGLLSLVAGFAVLRWFSRGVRGALDRGTSAGSELQI